MIADVQWKEFNPEFGSQDLSHHNEEEKKDDHHNLEFELDSIPKIHLRGKTQISQSSGLAIWTSAQVLFGYLDDNSKLVKGKDVVELGAGLGLCSITAHHYGAKRVLATDGDIDVLNNLRHNVNVNIPRINDEGKNYTPTQDDEMRTIACPQLVWGEGLQAFQDKHFRPDIIIGTDVLYHSRCLDPLWETVDALLKPGGSFVLSQCTHSVSVAEMLEKAREYGFTWKKPNITGSDEEEKEEDYLLSSDFGYHIFIFSR